MKILASIRLAEGADPRDIAPRIEEEIAGSWRLFASGVLREAYATEDARRVIFVLEVEDRKSAEQALQSLPLIRLGVFSHELIELRPFVNWSRLFSESAGKATAVS